MNGFNKLNKENKEKEKLNKENNYINLKQFLENKGLYYDETVLRIIAAKLQNKRKAFMLKGPAGTGKTSLAEAIAEFLNAELIVFQCTQGTSEDELLYKFIPSEESKSGIKITLGPLPKALLLSQQKKVVLLIDEFDKTRPSADALLLDFLQNYRLSLYLDDQKTIIKGNPENLVIFITSNDMREFSEPLIRRVTVLELNPLPVTKVLEILKKKFPENIAILLAQIYDDTIKAKLQKPATIQELKELGEILQQDPSIPLETLLRSFIIKYEEDWEKFINYIKNRKPYEFLENQNSRKIKITQYYKPEGAVTIKVNNTKNNETNNILEELTTVAIKEVEPGKIELEKVKEKKIVTAKIEDKDFEQYTNLIKALEPEPTERPDVFGVFKMVLDEENKKYIITEKPFNLSELEKICKMHVKGEYYFEDEVILSDEQIRLMIQDCTKIKYYTKNRLFLEEIYSDGIVKLDINIVEKDGMLNKVKIRGYGKIDYSTPNTLRILFNRKEGLEQDIGKILFERILSGDEKAIEMFPSKPENIKYIRTLSYTSCKKYYNNVEQCIKVLEVIEKIIKVKEIMPIDLEIETNYIKEISILLVLKEGIIELTISIPNKIYENYKEKFKNLTKIYENKEEIIQAIEKIKEIIKQEMPQLQ